MSSNENSEESGYIGVALQGGTIKIVSVHGMFTPAELVGLEVLIQKDPEQFKFGDGMYLFSCRAKEIQDETFWILTESGFTAMNSTSDAETVFVEAVGTVQ